MYDYINEAVHNNNLDSPNKSLFEGNFKMTNCSIKTNSIEESTMFSFSNIMGRTFRSCYD